MFQRISTLALLCAVALPLSAFKAYVYGGGSLEALAGSDDVRRIELNNGALKVIHTDGSESTVDAGKWTHIVPRWYDIYSSADNIAVTGLSVRFDGTALAVRAASEISSVTVHAIGGELMCSARPADTQVIVDLEALPAGVYIATVCCGADSQTLKFAKH